MAEDNKTAGSVGGPSSKDERGSRSPVKRTRKSHLASGSAGSKSKAKRDRGQDNLQKSNADRVTAEKEQRVSADKARLISTKLQTRDHVGKHPAEPDKHDSVEHAKVGLDEQMTGGEKIKVKTIDQKVAGKHVDTIAVVEGTEPMIGGDHPLSEGQRTAQTLREKGVIKE